MSLLTSAAAKAIKKRMKIEKNSVKLMCFLEDTSLEVDFIHAVDQVMNGCDRLITDFDKGLRFPIFE